MSCLPSLKEIGWHSFTLEFASILHPTFSTTDLATLPQSVNIHVSETTQSVSELHQKNKEEEMVYFILP